jgi:release factor glutamine methyltransferase
VAPLRTLVVDGAAFLSKGPYPDRASRDAEALLLHVADRNKAWLMAHAEDELNFAQGASYAQMLDRRFCGEPIQYITGETEFYGLIFHVTPDVLIPRPETEHLVEKVLELASDFEAPRIADIGTGSGCIAVALAHHLPRATITAIDISYSALNVARQNAALNDVDGRIRFLEGDLFAPVAEESFDIVVSNPPYVAASEISNMPAEVRDHEPARALFAGPDGLSVYLRLIPAAKSVLIPGGLLALEIGHGQSEPVAKLLAAAGLGQIEFVPDLQGIPRVACARR